MYQHVHSTTNYPGWANTSFTTGSAGTYYVSAKGPSSGWVYAKVTFDDQILGHARGENGGSECTSWYTGEPSYHDFSSQAVVNSGTGYAHCWSGIETAPSYCSSGGGN